MLKEEALLGVFPERGRSRPIFDPHFAFRELCLPPSFDLLRNALVSLLRALANPFTAKHELIPNKHRHVRLKTAIPLNLPFHLVLAGQNPIHYNTVPGLAGPRGHAFFVQLHG